MFIGFWIPDQVGDDSRVRNDADSVNGYVTPVSIAYIMSSPLIHIMSRSLIHIMSGLLIHVIPGYDRVSIIIQVVNNHL